MTIFNQEKNQKLTQLLKDSQQDFRFNQAGIKNRLMLNLDRKQFVSADPKFFQTKFFKISAGLALPIVLLTTTVALAANSKPGDKLFPINKLEEQFVLALPLSAQQKANIQTGIVTKRLQALTAVQTSAIEPSATREIETIKESDESLKNAIDTVSANRDQFEKTGQTQQAQELDASLTQLDNLAQEHEQKIQAIEQSIPAGSLRETIDQHLNEIKNTRLKTRLELKLDN